MRIAKIILPAAAIISLSLGGCATSPDYGLMPSASSAYPDPSMDVAMADDVAAQMVDTFPPALNKWNLSHDAKDPFGVELIKRLRAAGYAVEEFYPNKTSTSGDQLKYVVDNIVKGMWRVRVFAGQYTLTRAYQEPEGKTGQMIIIGPWVREGF